MSKILIINNYKKIEEKDIDLDRCCLRDFLYGILAGEFIALNKNIDGVQCICFCNSENNYDDIFLDHSTESSKVVIVKSDLLNGYIDTLGNYVCYYGFSNDEVLIIKKYIIMERNKFLNRNKNTEKKYVIYVDSYSKIKELFINNYSDTIKELVNNVLGDNLFTIPIKLGNLQCSIWFNGNKEEKINKSALNILDIGCIRGDFILTKYCRDYNYIVGKGCYTLDDGFNNDERELALSYLKDS